MHEIPDRRIDMLLGRYGESHRHPLNELIHIICIPAIIFSLLGLLWALHPLIAIVFSVGCLAYYLVLSPPFAFGMLLAVIPMLAVLAMLPPPTVLPLALAVFVAAWIGQFIGHRVEGQRPSFFDDLRFLLIGPLFVLGFLYRRLHIAY